VKRNGYCILLLGALCSAQAAALAATRDFKGTIGNKGVGLTLGAKKPAGWKGKGPVCGYYFYNQSLQDIPLQSGKADVQGQTVFYELDAKGNRTAVFKCRYQKPRLVSFFKIRPGIMMIGTWSHLNGSGSLPVRLEDVGSVEADGDKRYAIAGVADDEALEAKVQKWRNAVLSGNKQLVASMIKYPISISVNAKHRDLVNAAQLIANYDAVFTSDFVSSIRSAVPHNMFARADGVMLGEAGDVWFDSNGMVCTLNN
jgi:hypothetical protein